MSDFSEYSKIQDVYQGRLVREYPVLVPPPRYADTAKAPHIPKPFDTRHVPSTLVKKDLIEIGANYPEGGTPMLNYIFHGPNLPEYKPSLYEANHTCHEEKFQSPFNYSPSLYDLLQMSFNQIGTTTLNNTPRSMFVPPNQLHAISGSTVVEEFELGERAVIDMEVRPGVAVVRKDPKFRWSMLSAEEGQFDDATGPLADEISVFINAEGIVDGSGQIQEGSGSPPSSRSGIIVQQLCGDQIESNLKLELEPESEAVTPVTPSAPALTSAPCQKAIHRNAKFAATNTNSIVKFHTNIDANMSMSSLASGKNKTNFTSESTAPSSLGLELCVEGKSDVTGLTTFDSGILRSPAPGPREASHKYSVGNYDSLSRPDVRKILVSDNISEANWRTRSAGTFILGVLDVNKPLPPLPVGSNDDKNPTGDHTGYNTGDGGTNPGADTESKDYAAADVTDSIDGVAPPLTPTDEDHGTSQYFQDFHESVIIEICALFRRTALAASGWAKHFWFTGRSCKFPKA